MKEKRNETNERNEQSTTSGGVCVYIKVYSSVVVPIKEMNVMNWNYFSRSFALFRSFTFSKKGKKNEVRSMTLPLHLADSLLWNWIILN